MKTGVMCSFCSKLTKRLKEVNRRRSGVFTVNYEKNNNIICLDFTI